MMHFSNKITDPILSNHCRMRAINSCQGRIQWWASQTGRVTRFLVENGLRSIFPDITMLSRPGQGGEFGTVPGNPGHSYSVDLPLVTNSLWSSLQELFYPGSRPSPGGSRYNKRTLDRRSRMSCVDFKKWSCRMSLSYSCPMSPLRCCHVACRIPMWCHYFFWSCQ